MYLNIHRTTRIRHSAIVMHVYDALMPAHLVREFRFHVKTEKAANRLLVFFGNGKVQRSLGYSKKKKDWTIVHWKVTVVIPTTFNVFFTHKRQ